MCVGGLDSYINPLQLSLVACELCFSITEYTPINSPQSYNNIYWYLTENYSFGFAPNSSIDQKPFDIFALTDDNRLSWSLDSIAGIGRVGSIEILNSDTRYNKVILMAEIQVYCSNAFLSLTGDTKICKWIFQGLDTLQNYDIALISCPTGYSLAADYFSKQTNYTNSFGIYKNSSNYYCNRYS